MMPRTYGGRRRLSVCAWLCLTLAACGPSEKSQPPATKKADRVRPEGAAAQTESATAPEKNPGSATSSEDGSTPRPQDSSTGPQDHTTQDSNSTGAASALRESEGISISVAGATIAQLVARHESRPEFSPPGSASSASTDAGNPAATGDASTRSAATSQASLPAQISLPIRLDSAIPAVAADMVLNYDPAQLRYLTIRPGQAASDANKLVQANLLSEGQIKLVVFGLNATVMAPGEVAWADFEVVDRNSSAVPAVRITRLTIADSGARQIGVSGRR
jgi:hypothetical protein